MDAEAQGGARAGGGCPLRGGGCDTGHQRRIMFDLWLERPILGMHAEPVGASHFIGYTFPREYLGNRPLGSGFYGAACTPRRAF